MPGAGLGALPLPKVLEATADTERVQRYVKNLLGTLATDKVKGRALLEQHLGRSS